MKKVAIETEVKPMRSFAERRANRVAAKAELMRRIEAHENGTAEYRSLAEVVAELDALDEQ